MPKEHRWGHHLNEGERSSVRSREKESDWEPCKREQEKTRSFRDGGRWQSLKYGTRDLGLGAWEEATRRQRSHARAVTTRHDASTSTQPLPPPTTTKGPRHPTTTTVDKDLDISHEVQPALASSFETALHLKVLFVVGR